MAVFFGMEMRIILVILLVNAVTDVSADETRTALIAAGCVAGGLIVAAVAICAIYCILRHKRHAEKKPLPRYQEKASVGNGVYRPQRILTRSNTSIGQLSDLRDGRRSLGAKAFTQHEASPRQRPPVPFYTIRTDPRLLPEMPGVIHMGPPKYFRPPQVGRPVIFLDRKGTVQPKGASNDFMYPNSGTMLYYASGGAMTQSGNDNEERARRHVSRESHRDQKTRSRSQSHSRSHRPEMVIRRHSDTLETSVLGIPGDVILQKKIEDIRTYSRSLKQKQNDNNNNPFAVYFINKATDRPISSFENHTSSTSSDEFVKSDNKYISEGGRYSITQIQANNEIYPSMNKTTHASQLLFQEKERTIIFGDESDDLSSTPRKDYPNDTPRTSTILQLSGVDFTERRTVINPLTVSYSDQEETPRADYMPQRNVNIQMSEHFQINTGEIDDIIALSPQSTVLARDEYDNEIRDAKIFSHRQNPNNVRSASPPITSRPPTPPFDGTDVIFPSTLSIRQHHEEMVITAHKASRVPTPPPDMSPDREENPQTSLHFQVPSTPPPPPPAPPLPGNFKYKPPTPEMINNDHDLVIDDVNSPGKLSSKYHIENGTYKTSADNESKLGGLPFIEELRRRQRSIDEGVTSSPPLTISSSIPSPSSSFLSHQQLAGV